MNGEDPLLESLVLGALAVAALVGLVLWLVGRRVRAARRLAAEIRILVDANPHHRVHRPAPAELAMLAEAVEALAERRREAEDDVEVQVAAAGERLTRERNRLATLMAELGVAVVVCNADGRILLYNAAARATVADPVALGIGRPVQGVIDEELVAHAVERIRSGTPSAAATTIHRGRVLEVRVAPVAGDEPSGFVLLLEDLTDQLAAEDRRTALLRGLTEELRASVGSVRAAVEALEGYPDMDPEERGEFLRIIAEETHRLTGRVDRWGAESAALVGTDRPVSDVGGADLLRLVEAAVVAAGAGPVVSSPPGSPLWVGIESHAVTRGLTHLAVRLRARIGEQPLHLTARPDSGHARLELSWTGPPVPDEELREWAREPVAGGAVPAVAEVLGRHGGELWSGPADDGTAYLAVLLPLTDAGDQDHAGSPGRRAALLGTAAAPVPGSRPEFYDFDLFDRAEPTGDWRDRPLRELAYTVLDTETTGLHATEGDEVVAIGAVRVVNGRLLRQEGFERLVDPGRSVPAASTAVHGLTRSMLVGQPTVEEVLPELARYAADTVLVGHNIGFDLQFLRMKEPGAGVRLTQPVLDTLLLDAVAHPDHAEHSLESVAERLGVELVNRHSALGDALATAEVFLRLVPLLERLGIVTLGEAVRTSRSTYLARLDRRMYGG